MYTLPEKPVELQALSRDIAAIMPSFWTAYFDDREIVSGLGTARAIIHAQNRKNAREADLCSNRHTIPATHHESWVPLTIKKSETHVYGTDSLYGGNVLYSDFISYGQIRGEVRWLVRYPDDIVDVSLICSNITIPGSILVRGVDFHIDKDNKYISLTIDPFKTPGVPVNRIFDENGDVSDEYVTLWCFDVKQDRRFLEAYAGGIVRMSGPATEWYAGFLSRYFDMIQTGATPRGIEEAVLSAMGVPIPDRDGTVRSVFVESDGYTCVCTDDAVYRIPPGARVTVSAGDDIYAGAHITDTIKPVLLNGASPDYDSLVGLSVSAGDISGDYAFGIIIPSEVSSVYTDAGSSRFRIGGFDNDVDWFWHLARARQDEYGQLSTYLPAGRQLSPLEFMSSNLFGNNTVVYIVNAAVDEPDAPGTRHVLYLRETVPPRTMLIFYFEKEVYSVAGVDAGMGHVIPAAAPAPVIDTQVTGDTVSMSVTADTVHGDCCAAGTPHYTNPVGWWSSLIEDDEGEEEDDDDREPIDEPEM